MTNCPPGIQTIPSVNAGNAFLRFGGGVDGDVVCPVSADDDDCAMSSSVAPDGRQRTTAYAAAKAPQANSAKISGRCFGAVGFLAFFFKSIRSTAGSLLPCPSNYVIVYRIR